MKPSNVQLIKVMLSVDQINKEAVFICIPCVLSEILKDGVAVIK